MKRTVSILLAALLLLLAVPTFAEGDPLKGGVYVSDAGTEVLYLDAAGVGVYDYYSDEYYYSNGVLWTGTSLEIERMEVPCTFTGDTLSFTYKNIAVTLRYQGESPAYAFGDGTGTSYAGAYRAEGGQALTLNADGTGVYADAVGETQIYWGSMVPYWTEKAAGSGFVLFGSFLTALDFKDGAVVLTTEFGEEIALLSDAAPKTAAADGLQPGLYLYANEETLEFLYLNPEGVGTLSCNMLDGYYENGAVWTATSLEIERIEVPFTLSDGILSFSFDGVDRTFQYEGEQENGFVLGDVATTSFAGVYRAEGGQTLILNADGTGVYTDAAGETAIFWGSTEGYFPEDEVDGGGFALFGSFLSGIDFKDGGAVLYTESGEEIALTLDTATKTAAAAGLQPGLYADGRDVLYLYENGAGLFSFLRDGEVYGNGVRWIEGTDSLEIERSVVPIRVRDDLLAFTFRDTVWIMTYEGPADSFQLGDAAFVGTYAAEDGQELILSADGSGVYTREGVARDVLWGNSRIFRGTWEGQPEGECFILFDSFMSNLVFEGDAVALLTDGGETVVLQRQGGKAAAAGEQLYYGYSMTSDGQIIELIPFLKAMGMDPTSIFIILRDDGTGHIQMMDEANSVDFTWTEDAFHTEVDSIPYTREGDHIILSVSGETIEFIPAAELTTLLYGSDLLDPIDPANGELAGHWTFTKARAMGMEISASDMGTKMSLTLNADGTAVLSTDNETNDLEWFLKEDGSLSLTVAGTEVFTMNYDGTALILDTGAGVEMVFEKAD